MDSCFFISIYIYQYYLYSIIFHWNITQEIMETKKQILKYINYSIQLRYDRNLFNIFTHDIVQFSRNISIHINRIQFQTQTLIAYVYKYISYA